jgi:hypothetical protein
VVPLVLAQMQEGKEEGKKQELVVEKEKENGEKTLLVD